MLEIPKIFKNFGEILTFWEEKSSKLNNNHPGMIIRYRRVGRREVNRKHSKREEQKSNKKEMLKEKFIYCWLMNFHTNLNNFQMN